MLPRDKFDHFKPQADPYYREIPDIRLDGLKPKSSNVPVISVMISTWNRYSQLARSLECYARQEFRDFEILLNDDGSTQNIKALVEQFSPYVNIKYYHTPRSKWVSCGSPAYKKMMPDAQGKIIAITHPEIMISFDALQFVHDVLLKGKQDEIVEYVINYPPEPKWKWKWVSLRPNFFVDGNYELIDVADWHSSLDKFQGLPSWENWGGFAGRPNSWHSNHFEYPWWFFGAALKECPIWDAMVGFVGHATLDMWMMKYRAVYHLLDVVPDKVMCYHQPHVTSAVAPEGEAAGAMIV
jgi:glycosyltransferase involved in cell wall biosynthesis